MTLKVPETTAAKRDLFTAYARFEFALKESGFLVGKNGERATPDWLRFSVEESLAGICDDLSGDEDVAALIAEPPRQQIVDAGAMVWAERIQAPISTSRDLLLAVKTVRDNLFHGGKAGENPRDDALCRAAIKVLTACLDRQPNVRAMFNGEY